MKKKLCILLIFLMLLCLVGCESEKNKEYQEALSSIQAGDYAAAIEILESLGDFKDSEEKLVETKCEYASNLVGSGDYITAIDVLESIADYGGVSAKLAETKYEYASELLSIGSYGDAEKIYESLGDYSDSEDMMNYCRYLSGTEALNNLNYNEAASIFRTVNGSYKEDAERMIEAINCIDVADEITATLQNQYSLSLPDSYLHFFSLDFDLKFYYDVQSYSYYFDIYFPEGFSSLIPALTFGTESLASTAQDIESGKLEYEIYKMFYDRGFGNINVFVEYLEYDGTLLKTLSYSPEDYEAQLNADALAKSEAIKAAENAVKNYTLITNNELYLDAQGAVNPEYNGKPIRMENLLVVTYLENTDGSMDCDMAVWVSTGIGIAIDLEINDQYTIQRIREGAEYVNIYGILNIEPNTRLPEADIITLTQGGIYFDDIDANTSSDVALNTNSTSSSNLPDSDADYLYPSDSKYITDDELRQFTHDEIVLIRNEIYARHGCNFNNIDIRSYFESQSWYHPVDGLNASNFDSSILNDYELANIDTILAYEREMGWRS